MKTGGRKYLPKTGGLQSRLTFKLAVFHAWASVAPHLRKCGNLPIQEILFSSLWLFAIYHKFPEIPVGMSMVNVLLVCFTGKFPGQTEILKR